MCTLSTPSLSVRALRVSGLRLLNGSSVLSHKIVAGLVAILSRI